MIPSNGSQRGIVYTFYSFKGGVGRSMALANVAALMAKWGHSVLVVDWDLEAPGLEKFFERVRQDVHELRGKTPGIVDLVQATTNGNKLSWRDCLIEIEIPGGTARLSFLSAGRSGPDYTARLQSLNFEELFDKQGLGTYVEELRNDWISEFDFVLVDSRTGVTDIGGICTVHLADVLVLLFTTTESSVDGTMQVVERARKAQQLLPLDRRRLLAVPVPARDESRTEYEKATQWKNRFAERFSELYRDWLPSGKTAQDAVELLRLPYVPYWSFGEQLPVILESTADPTSLGHAYEILARMLAARLDWYAALEGQTLAPPPAPQRRELDREWLGRHRKAALEGLAAAGLNGFMEVWHLAPTSSISKTQAELLTVASEAQVPTYKLPTGVVDRHPGPRPTNDGIVARLSAPPSFFPGRLFIYWTLTKSGDFYTLTSLPEDQHDAASSSKTIGLGARVGRAAESLLHCANLYRLLGVEPNAYIELAVSYGGLRERSLGNSSLMEAENLHEDEVTIPPITFRLGAIDTEIVDLVKKLCAPLFVVFDFATFPDEVYRQIVTDFVRGKVA